MRYVGTTWINSCFRFRVRCGGRRRHERAGGEQSQGSQFAGLSWFAQLLLVFLLCASTQLSLACMTCLLIVCKNCAWWQRKGNLFVLFVWIQPTHKRNSNMKKTNYTIYLLRCLCHATTSSYFNWPPKQSSALPMVKSTLPRPTLSTISISSILLAPPA